MEYVVRISRKFYAEAADGSAYLTTSLAAATRLSAQTAKLVAQQLNGIKILESVARRYFK